MKKENIHYLIGFILITATLSSCSTKRNITYLRDLEAQVLLEGIPSKPDEHIIRPTDNLFISVRTINPEINELFAISAGGDSPGGIRFESQAGQHINGFQVDNGGNINLPVLGSIHLAGLTLMQAQAAVQKRANEYLKDANIQVKLLNYRVSILGEVGRPDVYFIYNNSLTLLEAISMAGGATDFANLRRISVVRQTGSGTKSYNVDITSKNALRSEAFHIYSNDVIYIRPQKLKNTRLNSGMYALFLSTLTTFVVIMKYLSD